MVTFTLNWSATSLNTVRPTLPKKSLCKVIGTVSLLEHSQARTGQGAHGLSQDICGASCHNAGLLHHCPYLALVKRNRNQRAAMLLESDSVLHTGLVDSEV